MTTKYQPLLGKDFGKLPSSLKDSALVFSCSRFSVRNNGKRDAVIHPGAVVILPMLDEHTLILIRNERFAIGKTLWELPAGTLETNEHPQETAARELVEETGYEAGKIEFLTDFYTTPGFCNEKMFAYTAKDLKLVGQKLEETENIIVEQRTWNEVLKMIFNGEIHDAKTLTTLLFYYYRNIQANLSNETLK
ncbi:MAG: NUDIX hydrolase [Parachlamydiaceae bacterium]|nr:MAG: NUDIX hydrolase [Parachlamydiaceae bacterium]